MIKKLIKRFCHLFNIEIVNYRLYNQNLLSQKIDSAERVKALDAINRLNYIISNTHEPSQELNEINFLCFGIDKIMLSNAQLFQDLFVLYYLKNKRNGFFIEFGATDGITLSNTYLLEDSYHWNGILCEPGKIWQKKLSANRKCIVDFRCVWSKSGETLQFNETKIPELSAIETFNESDYHSKNREEGLNYSVETISLNDLLVEYKAPHVIDYLSIDTEGSEFDILKEFDFEKFKISVITVEHNFSPKREEIYKLLTCKGYKRVFEKLSLFDDWYVFSENV